MKSNIVYFSFDSVGNSNKKYPPSITSLPSDMNGLSTRMNGLSTRSTSIDPSKASENETQTQSKIFYILSKIHSTKRNIFTSCL